MTGPATTISTLRQYMEHIEDLMARKEPLWYRGIGHAAFHLVPSLYRHPTISSPAELIALEGRILQRFRERSIPYLPARVEEDWELLFLMQHFGVPTRLLDWTENPYVALFFALTTVILDSTSQEATAPAAVWVLRPENWNRSVLADISYDGGILSTGIEPLESYKPSENPRYMRVAPVALYGLHNNPRIVAQRGVFTIFGQTDESMDQLHLSAGYPSDILVKIEIAQDAVVGLRESLFAIGITDSVVYPDLGGLATELRRFFGFGA